MYSNNDRPNSSTVWQGVTVLDRFVCVLADTSEAREAHFRVRYRVFCEEAGFESADAFPDGMECDGYDTFAQHFIVWDRFRRQWAGAMRLVDAARTRLPCEDISTAPLMGLGEQRPWSVEFSRLCILREYRHTTASTFLGRYQRAGSPACDTVSAKFVQEDHDILLRLLRASFDGQFEARFCYFIVTKALSRVLGRFGIPLTRVGEDVSHRGTRIPFRYSVADAAQGMRDTLPGFARMLERSQAFMAYSKSFGDRGIRDRDRDRKFNRTGGTGG